MTTEARQRRGTVGAAVCFAPEVRSYRPTSPEAGVERPSLGVEIDALLDLHAQGFADATVFHAARLTELLVREATTVAGCALSQRFFTNTLRLERLGLLPVDVLYWVNFLRRIGNVARHMGRPLSDHDADVVVVLTERVIDWYFERFPFGPKLASASGEPGTASGEDPIAELRAFARALEKVGRNEEVGAGFLSELAHRHELLDQSPALPALLGQILIDRAELDLAGPLLERSSVVFLGNPRLQQLLGLYYSRIGELQEARRILEPLRLRNPQDPESNAILAGVLKRMWIEDPEAEDCLERASDLYEAAFRSSHESDVYPLINSATLNRFRGRTRSAREMARTVCEVLGSVHAEGAPLGWEDRLRYWDLASLAEAHLLQGHVFEARALYTKAFDRAQAAPGMLEGTRGQAEQILRKQGLGCLLPSFWDPPGPPEEPGVLISVVGHRRLPGPEAQRRRLRALLDRIGIGRPASLMSSLAEGADRLAAEALVDDAGLRLHALLPLDPAEFRLDFEEPGSFADLEAWLCRADSIEVCTGEDGADTDLRRRELCYAAGERLHVERCSILVAIWDGEPARGPGGTAGSVQYARELRKPLVWLRPEPDAEPIFENFSP